MEDKDRDYLFEIGGQINSMYLATHRSEDHLSSISHGIEEIKKEIYEINKNTNDYMTYVITNRNQSTAYLKNITVIMLPIIAGLLLTILIKI